MITSTGNLQIKNVLNLNKKSKDRKAQGLFVVEGKRIFEETPADRIEKVFVTEDFEKQHRELLKKHAYELVSDQVFSYMSDTKTPQGILALVRIKEHRIEDILAKQDITPLILVMENIQDPGNLGTMIRTAEGAGATGIIMTGGTADVYNPKVIRSTMGSLYRMPFVYMDTIEEVMEILHKNSVTTYAAHLKGSCSYDEADYTRAAAFLVGNEGNGLTDKASDLSSQLIRIPMGGQLESLNAAVSGAVLMYEAARQRRVK